MEEKYLHSLGAQLMFDGRFEEAIERLYEAISIDETPHVRYALSQAFLGKGDIERALEEINRAITLNPRIPEYYLERSAMYRLFGDARNGENDAGRAIKIDQNYRRIDMIRHAVKTVREAFSGDLSLEGFKESKPKSRVLRGIVRDIENSRQTATNLLENSSCVLPCPGYCCHFSGATITHGLSIGPWKLLTIQNFLRRQGLTEKDYLCRMTISGETRFSRLIPPHHVVKEGGELAVYFPARQSGSLSSNVLRDAPKDIDYKSLVWINKRSKPCVFLQDRRCMIHDLGDEQGLPSCKEFLCMTGFVFVLLDYLQMVDMYRVASKTCGELNRIAIEALLIMGSGLFENENLKKLRSTMKRLMQNAIKEDSEENESLVDSSLKEYCILKNRYEHLFLSQKEHVRIVIDRLFSR
jgi:tetratricopeptide (TPR) repeat protein